MPTDIKLWRIRKEGQEEKVVEIPASKLSELGPREEYLQNLILKYPEIIEEDLTIIGKEIESIDILGINSEGRVVVIETKRDEPRDAVGQALDYASLVSEKDKEWLKQKAKGVDLSEYEEIDLEDPVIYVVGTEPDEKIERMVRFLAKYELDINVIIVRFHKDENGELYLTRTYAITDEEKEELKGKRIREIYHWDEESYVQYAKRLNEMLGNNVAKFIEEVKKHPNILFYKFGEKKYSALLLYVRNKKILELNASFDSIYIHPDNIKGFESAQSELFVKTLDKLGFEIPAGKKQWFRSIKDMDEATLVRLVEELCNLGKEEPN